MPCLIRITSIPLILDQAGKRAKSSRSHRFGTCAAASVNRSPEQSRLKTCPLPNGERVAYISKPDIAFLYREIFEEHGYLRHGITLQEGDTVLDIGANIGLFAAFASQKVGRHGRVIAVEPIPAIFEALTYNMKHLCGRGMPGLLCVRQCVWAISIRACFFSGDPKELLLALCRLC